MALRTVIWLSLFGIMAGCFLGKKQVSSPPSVSFVRENKAVLSEIVAQNRGRLVSNLHYDLTFWLDGNLKNKGFRGQVKLTFSLASIPEFLSIDFKKGSPDTMIVNGVMVREVTYNDAFISLPVHQLKVGTNQVWIDFEQSYSTDGSGLYRFEDPEDGAVYVYTDFEPYHANRLFPCFDQPDLKATYTVTVTVPEEWTVVTSNREIEKKRTKSGMQTWKFPKSALFSTYLFSLHAGPFAMWEDGNDSVPLRLFARKSLASFVNVDDWLTVTRQGFEFYNAFFDYSYPFEKYDQIIVPDFNSGAMENVGAVTFSENYVHRGMETRRDRRRRASTILHEMAHMWFGNLVTMTWWNDLWLNESFATYMANLALFQATEFKEAWQEFYLGTKQWAYWEDQLVTTHPIESDVSTTDEAFSNFDGITYGKGASVLKQLVYLIGEDPFRKGVQAYFKIYAFKNASRQDFIKTLELYTEKAIDLDVFTKTWLQTKSLNRIEPVLRCGDDGKISELTLRQSHVDPEFGVYRQHRTQIALFNLDPKTSELILTAKTALLYQDEVTPVLSLKGKPCPDLILPNYEDYDFVKIKFDQKSLKTIFSALTLVKSDFTRLMLWRSVWDMVGDADLSVTDYLELIQSYVPKEKNRTALAKILETIEASASYLEREDANHEPVKTPSDEPRVLDTKTDTASSSDENHEETSAMEKAEDVHQDLVDQDGDSSPAMENLERFCWSQQAKAKDLELQKMWLETCVAIATSDESLVRVLSLLEPASDQASTRLPIDQELRWSLLERLNTYA